MQIIYVFSEHLMFLMFLYRTYGRRKKRHCKAKVNNINKTNSPLDGRVSETQPQSSSSVLQVVATVSFLDVFSYSTRIFLCSQLFCLGFKGRGTSEWWRWDWNPVTDNINTQQGIWDDPGIRGPLKTASNDSHLVFEICFCTTSWLSVWAMQPEVQLCLWAFETQTTPWKPSELWSQWKGFHRAGRIPQTGSRALFPV